MSGIELGFLYGFGCGGLFAVLCQTLIAMWQSSMRKKQ